MYKNNNQFKENIITNNFRKWVGYELNLDSPKTFNEKLQWLKLYYHDPLMTKCADKYAVRKYVKETIGEEYLIPLIGVWDRVEDIDFDLLPNQFVLKVNWGSGMNIIVKDKNKLDVGDTKKKLSSWMKPSSNHYYTSYEWCYKNIEPKIICEKYIEQMDGNLIDYKLFLFNGTVKYIDIHIFRFTENHSRCFYDINWNKYDATIKFNLFKGNLEKPKVLDELLMLGEKLGKCFPHVRVDFYIIENKIFFGEMTFYNGSGYDCFKPQEWDYKFGELLELPKEKKLEYDDISKEELLNQIKLLEPFSKEIRDLEEKNTYLKNVLKDVKKENTYLNQTLKDKYEELERLYKNKTLFNLLSIFNFSLFSFNIDEKYIKIIILGIKIAFKRKLSHV